MKQNKKSNKVLFGLLSSSILFIPFAAVSCRCEKEKKPDNPSPEKDDQIDKELDKLKAVPTVNKATTSVSDLKESNINFYGYNKAKYEINSVSLDESESDLGILN